VKYIPKKRSRGSRASQARWKRLRAKNPWGYDNADTSIRGERTGRGGRWHLHDSQLANLDLGKEHNAQIARENRAMVQRWRSKGYSARDIVMLTGLSRPTVYRHLAVMRDPLLL
jgi:hypothetical protein